MTKSYTILWLGDSAVTKTHTAFLKLILQIHQMSFRIVFRIFLAFLIFDPNWPLCKGYRLCMVYSLWMRRPNFKILSFLEYSFLFSERLFAQKNSNVLVELFLTCFKHFQFLTQTDQFAKAIAFAWDGHFSKFSHFSNIWCFFELFFEQNNSNVLVESFFACFWHF